MVSHHSHDISVALAIMLLKKHQNAAEYIDMGNFSYFKKLPIGLKENLQEEDNLSTRDNQPVPNVSFVRRFYCIRYPCKINTPLIGTYFDYNYHIIQK